MISIKTTPKYNGITIQGDFDDLNNLYDALSNYIDFYIDGIIHEIESDYVKEHGVALADMTSDEKSEFFALNQSEIAYFEEIRDNFLGLCYDIRHAFQGARGVALVENGRDLFYGCGEDFPKKNLQFNVEILYPWAFYYLFTLQDILDNMYKPEWFNVVGEYGVTHKELDIQLYRATLSTFVALLWKNLEELFGKDFATLYNYYNYKDCSALADSPYLTGMCNYLVADHCEGLSAVKYKNFKKNILLALAYDCMDTDNLYDIDYGKEKYVIDSNKQYKKAIEYVNKNATLPYVTKREFWSELLKLSVCDNEDIAEEWLAKIFGNADWDNLEW